jgi:replicative DNA helicase
MSAEIAESTVYMGALVMLRDGTDFPGDWGQHPDAKRCVDDYQTAAQLLDTGGSIAEKWPSYPRPPGVQAALEDWRAKQPKPDASKIKRGVSISDDPNWLENIPKLASEIVARSMTNAQAAEASAGDEAEGWDEPLPLGPPAKLPCPPLDIVAPPALARMADAVATSYQVPADLPLLLGISTIAAAVGGRFVLNVRPDWEEQLSIYALVALAPANRKSPVFNAMTGVMKRYETQIVEGGRGRRGMHNAEGERIEKRKGKLEKNLADTGRLEVDQQAELDALTKESIDFDEWQDPQLIANDTTPEALASIMRYNGNRMAIMAPEAGVFNVIAGLYNGGQPNVDIFLSSWCGDDITINRKGNAGPIKLNGPALSVGLTTQPEMVRQLSEKKSFRGSGLLARFLYAVPDSLLGSRDLNSPPVPAQVRLDWEGPIEALLSYCHPDDKFEDRKKKNPFRMTLSVEALEVLSALNAKIEPQLKENTGELSAISDWGGKIVGQLARVAALYTLFENADSFDVIDERPDRSLTEVSGETMTRAVTLAPYLISQAQAAFGAMSPNAGRYANAASIVAAIKAKPEDRRYGFTARDVQTWVKRQTWAKEGGVEEVKAALMDLMDSGHIALAQNMSTRRNASQRYDANPHLFA